MNKFKNCQVVMLSTNEKAKVGMINLELLNSKGNQLELIHYVTNGDGLNPQNLYILSNDKIKEGDWYYDTNLNKIKQALEVDSDRIYYTRYHCTIPDKAKKIISTTDTTLYYEQSVYDPRSKTGGKQILLPQPSIQFINKFIEEYNKGYVIENVLVEYEKSTYNDWIKTGEAQPEFKLKVNHKDNTITIKKVKDIYNKEEIPDLVIKLCKEFQSINKHNTLDFYSDNKFKEYIKNNI